MGIRYIKGIGYEGYSTCRNPAFLGRKFGSRTRERDTLEKIGSYGSAYSDPVIREIREITAEGDSGVFPGLFESRFSPGAIQGEQGDDSGH